MNKLASDPRLALATLLLSLLSVPFSRSGIAAEPVDPRKPAAIKTTGVPLVPADLTTRLNQYQNTRAASFLGWSPTGQGMLISTRFGNSAQLHLVSQPGGRREQLTFDEEPVTGRFIPQATDGALLLSSDRGGNENAQLFLFDRAHFRRVLLTDGKSRNNVGPFRHDGSSLIIASNRRNGRDMDLYELDPRRPTADEKALRLVLTVDKQTWNPVAWSPDGKQVLIIRYVSINESYPALLDVQTGQKTDLPLPTKENAAFGPALFAADGKSLLIASDAGGEFRRLARYDLATQKYQWLTDDLPWDIADLEVHAETGDVVFTINEDGASRLYRLPHGRLPRETIELPLGIIAGLEFSADGKQLGFTLARPDAPADAYSLDLATRQLTRWTYSEVGGLDPATFVTPTRIQYPSFDQRLIPAYYFRPQKATAAQPAPVLINIHGGPESQYRPFFSGVGQFYLNEMGFAVIHPNVRGSSGYGKTYLKLDNAALREDSVRDIGALLDWIERQPELDKRRVAVAGGSYGGYMVLASLTHYGERIRAGVDIVGICNFLTFLERTAGYRVDLRRAEYGDERDPEMKRVFERISPLNQADKIRSALMVVHGVNDPRVPFFEAQQIAEKVTSRGQPVWTVFADNEGHGFSKKDNADYLRAVEAMFLLKFLGNSQ
ncbi:MAG: alpha/beta fold hydrolase [Planctomycetota bacterium]